MNIFITGVAGFVGSNLAREFLRQEHRVIGFDNFSQGFRRNIEDYVSHPDFTLIEGDVRDAAMIKQEVCAVDMIVHLAAFKIPRYGHALDTLTINTKGTENILEAARERKIRVVFTSTSDVYGKNPKLPFSEDSSDAVYGSSRVKRWSYAVSKMFDEHMCFGYYDEHRVPVVVLRLFGGYGIGQNPSWWGGPQAAFMQAILEGKPMEIHGTGKQTRSFTHISDTVAGIIAATKRDEAIGHVLNIGSTDEISIIELAHRVWKASGQSGEPDLVFRGYNTFNGKYEDVLRRIPDITLSKKILGVQATKDLDQGLKETFAWQKSLYTRAS